MFPLRVLLSLSVLLLLLDHRKAVEAVSLSSSAAFGRLMTQQQQQQQQHNQQDRMTSSSSAAAVSSESSADLQDGMFFIAPKSTLSKSSREAGNGGGKQSAGNGGRDCEDGSRGGDDIDNDDASLAAMYLPEEDVRQRVKSSTQIGKEGRLTTTPASRDPNAGAGAASTAGELANLRRSRQSADFDSSQVSATKPHHLMFLHCVEASCYDRTC